MIVKNKTTVLILPTWETLISLFLEILKILIPAIAASKPVSKNNKGLTKTEVNNNVKPLNNLSANGSIILPYLDWTFHFLAKKPSKASVISPIKK